MTSTPNSSKCTFSSSLKERLKRCGRYHSSPYQPPGPAKQNQNISLKKGTAIPKIGNFSVHRVNNSEEKSELANKDGQIADESSELRKEANIYDNASMCSDDSLSLKAVTNDYTSERVKDKLESLCCGHEGGTRLSHSDTDLLSRNTTFVTPIKNRDQVVKRKTLSFRNNIDEHCKSTEHLTYSAEADVADVEVDQHFNEEMHCSVHGLENELTSRKELLRKLKMVKMYREKNNLSELEVLITKWRGVSQQALQDLHQSMPEPRPSLTELINHLGIDHNLVCFSSEDDETFT
ncbi:SFR1-like protein [Mya arenaria]|uniref:Swi5-dependent recombination DNA repair protein 1 homolog n=1 Tax=Mya arenaria TaxID=6604 RepID=A0ABY7FJ32_MYAAR|nr:swi5-dependent recombination DNA repair protein 1 homolog [Mya arenaria]XP_052773606.1 swi5-dependent recombination DNA repair protein 1 homolog [Mya arenaria]XP_052773607.1 swi5-dependent recombination DNA repair protein 1 homolog [Mya arenaria]WAR21572.1 SFR1-like protein [Mya arenaria]